MGSLKPKACNKSRITSYSADPLQSEFDHPRQRDLPKHRLLRGKHPTKTTKQPSRSEEGTAEDAVELPRSQSLDTRFQAPPSLFLLAKNRQNGMFPLSLALSGDSFVFLQVGPSIFFLVFPLFFLGCFGLFLIDRVSSIFCHKFLLIKMNWPKNWQKTVYNNWINILTPKLLFWKWISLNWQKILLNQGINMVFCRTVQGRKRCAERQAKPALDRAR